LICLSDLSDARFFATSLELKVNRVVLNYLFGLRRGDCMIRDVVDVGLIPIEQHSDILLSLAVAL